MSCHKPSLKQIKTSTSEGGESLTGANKGTSGECCRGLRWGENLINKDIPSGIL